MSGMRVLTAAEQVAAHLRAEVLRGRHSGVMPGVLRLEAELGVNRNTLEAALRQLETEGLLVPQGTGKRRLIQLGDAPASPALRVAMVMSDLADRKLGYVVELQHALAEAGHTASYAPGSMTELGMDVKRIARMVGKIEAEAWVVVAASRDVLEWFAGRPDPAFAVFGRRRGLPIAGAGPDKQSAYAEATRTLIGLGHRRIVLLARPRRRLPEPGASEQAFLDELAAHGISPSPYHLPDWEESIEGFRARLESLFQITPPTTLIVDEAALFIAAFQFCASRGLRVPEDVSLVCTDSDSAFDWCHPTFSHIHWDSGPVVRRAVRWAANVSAGKTDLRQTLTPSKFVRGGTIGPAKGS